MRQYIIVPAGYEGFTTYVHADGEHRISGTNADMVVQIIADPTQSEWSTILYKLQGDPRSKINARILDGNCLDSIAKDWIPYINENKCQIIIDTSSESWGPIYENYDRRHNDEKINLHVILTEKAQYLGIDPTRVTWVTGDLNAEKYLVNFDGIKVKSYCAFYYQWSVSAPDNLIDFSKFDFLKEQEFNTNAVCLMRDSSKEHRLYTVNKIVNDDIRWHDIMTTMPQSLYNNTICDNFKHHYIYYRDTAVPYDWDNFRSHILKYYTHAPHTVPNDDIKQALHQSLFSLVSESDCQSGKMFITYSTFRAILAIRPFVIIGNSGILQQLKDWGFRTYASIVDETYDTEQDMYRRVSLAIDSLMAHKFQDLSRQERFDKVKDIAEYNRAHLINTLTIFHNEYLNLFKGGI